MKKILITGANSYIGTSFEKWMQQFGDRYHIDTIDMHGDQWKEKDFSQYHSVFHVAGIAHADVSKVSEEIKQLYYKVNSELAYETAKKYKNDLRGANGQFIFMSSIIIYGEETNINIKKVITPETEPSPSNFYGDSKWQAEKLITPLKSKNFKIAIIRPPMIYGENGKGNYQELVKIAKITPFFPYFENERSMLSINRLSSFLKNIIDNNEYGIFFPQDPNYINTSMLVEKIAKQYGRKIYIIKGLSWLIILGSKFPGRVGKIINKAFGSLIYMSEVQDENSNNKLF
ncbi:sugar nucleotide-binding protein [Enterococcus casseliflavus]|uniref:sugar nucleotide-binding protein n=1 Tax=Enterococcus casseliflavus TaxID=37734 RepID=UPI0011576E01|nr:sugar nucleotide-binding protein [Enterococcus casseliflavus]